MPIEEKKILPKNKGETFVDVERVINVNFEEEMKILESELIDCLRSYFNVETNTTYSDHPHDIWHGWDNLIRSLNNASNIAEKLMKQLGYEHD